MWASWQHWYFSNIVDEANVTFRHLQLSDEQGWWGKEVIIVYDYEPFTENIDTFKGGKSEN
jgi:hypothetical protein